jgi:(1->4)-alpha-D-glucan 1-alpha-D-glucosylmutase
MEDTAFYVYNRLISLNEVGGAPDRFGNSIDSFHRQNRERLETSPHAMITTSTHDTKRSEDVRARINVLSEIPDVWRKALTTWSHLNRKLRKDSNGQQAPDRNEEYLLYQTLLGIWPHEPCQGEEFSEFRQRIKDYMRKALREAKVHSSWMNPDTAREEAVDTFIDTILGGGDTRFVRSFLGLAGYVNRLGMFNSLSQTLLKITSPGIPDFYQGSELWDLSLVDPDNRRPVDFAKRVKILHQLQIKEQQLGLSALGADLLTRMEDGSIKLFLTWKALTFRRNNLDIFEQGSYTPLAVKGEQAESVIVFARTIEEKMVLVIVPRFLSRVIRDDVSPPLGRAAWGDTLIELPEDASGINYRNIFTGEPHKGKTADRTLFLGDILQQFPVALLELAIQGEYS